MKRISIIIAGMLLTLIACQQNSSGPDVLPEEGSELVLSFPISQQIQHLVATAEAVVSAADMDTIVAELTVTDDAVEGSIEDIPAGDNRHFEVFVYNDASELTYFGEANANVPAGQTIVLNITLYPQVPNVGTVIINGTFFNSDSSLVAHWSFSGNANDISGNENHGVNYGAALTADRFGNPESAYQFDLSSATRIEVADHESLDFGTGDFAISGWIKTDMTLTDHNGAAIMDKYPQNALPWTLRLAVDGRLRFLADSSVYSINTVNDNVWHHFVAMRENGTIKLYVDNELQGSNISTTTASNNNTLCFGCIHDSSIRRLFDGSIDDVRIYNRALSLDEIAALFVAVN